MTYLRDYSGGRQTQPGAAPRKEKGNAYISKDGHRDTRTKTNKHTTARTRTNAKTNIRALANINQYVPTAQGIQVYLFYLKAAS